MSSDEEEAKSLVLTPMEQDSEQEKGSGTGGIVMNEFIKGDFKLSMWIPSELAGKVIGKMGTVITNLTRETRAKIINACPIVGESLWLAVVIHGDIKSCTAAYNAISHLVDDEVDDVVLEFTINTKKPFFLYGSNKLITTKRVSATTSVRIFFPEYDHKQILKNPSQSAPPVGTLEGSFKDVQRALNLLDDEALSYKEQQKTKREAMRLEREKEDESGTDLAIDGKQITTANKDTIKNNTFAAENKLLKNGDTTISSIRDTSKEAVSLKEPRSPLIKQERPIQIPGSLVGLLLTKPPHGKKQSVLNQIQLATSTVISKVVPGTTELGTAGGEGHGQGLVNVNAKANTSASASGPTIDEDEDDGDDIDVIVGGHGHSADDAGAQVSSGRRRRGRGHTRSSDSEEDSSDSDSDDSSSTNSDGDDSGAEEEEEVEEVEGEEEEDKEDGEEKTPEVGQSVGEGEEASKAEEGGVAVVVASTAANANPNDPVTFRVIGFELENIELAIESLRKIIGGQHIYEVLAQLKIDSKILVKFKQRASGNGNGNGNGNKDFKDRKPRGLGDRGGDRGPGNGGRPAGGRSNGPLGSRPERTGGRGPPRWGTRPVFSGTGTGNERERFANKGNSKYRPLSGAGGKSAAT